jgi:hypothetical protein
VSRRGELTATKKAAKKASRRTVLYSSAGKKLCAVRDASGKFKDIQQYAHAHAADIRAGSTAEEKAAKKAAKAPAKKATKQAAKTAAKKGPKAPAKKASAKTSRRAA